MKNFTTRTLIAAAAFVAAAGMASAQTLKAEIPFAFRAYGVAMAPGTYEVTGSYMNGTPVFRVSSGKKSVLLIGSLPSDPSKEWRAEGTPKLMFECGYSDCTLIKAWNGEAGRAAYTFSHPKRNEPTHLATITLIPYKSE